MPEIEFPNTLNVTDQEIDISFLTSTQREFYYDLFQEIIVLYGTNQKPRFVVGLAGPTGSGKSVIAALFEVFSKQLPLPMEFNAIGIDAFSYTNEFLESHADSEGNVLKKSKGRFDTYDVQKLVSTLRNFKEGKQLSLPEYSRITHDPVEHKYEVTNESSLLLVEGLWLLFDREGWENIGAVLDYCIFIHADKNTVRDMIMQRHVRGGRSAEEAASYYDTVDAANFDLVMSTKDTADKIIPSYYELP